MINFSVLALAACCASLFGTTQATPASTQTSSALPASSTIAQHECSSHIGLTNGGFESGKIAPWDLQSGGVQQHIVTPGYKSRFALQADFAPSDLVEYYLVQDIPNKECYDSYYQISYSWNWVNYTGPEGPAQGEGDSIQGQCGLRVYTGNTEGTPSIVPIHYGSRKPGWHHHSYVAQNTQNTTDEFVASLVCTGVNNTEVLPPFSIQIDDLKFRKVRAPSYPLSQ